MTILDVTYQVGSFKGVVFEVDTTSMEIGRRGALHEYVDEDLPYFEDLGRKARRYVVSVYFRGDDHLTQAKRLQEALERPDAGYLTLPNRERELVYCTEASRNEALKSNKGETTFDLTFIEAGEFKFPVGLLDTITELVDAAAGAVADVADFVTIVRSSVSSAVASIRDAASLVQTSIRGLSPSENNLPDLASFMSEIGASGDPMQAAGALLDLAQFESAVNPVHNGPKAQAAYAEALEFDRRFRVIAAIEAAKVATRLVFTNRRDIIAYRDAVLDALARDYGGLDSTLAADVLDVRSKFMTDMSRRIVVLPAFVTVDLGTSFPSVVAAHKVLGDYKRENDMRRWNATYHPLFMPRVVEAVR